MDEQLALPLEDLPPIAEEEDEPSVTNPHGNAKPTEVTDIYWLCAFRKRGHYPAPTPRCGKWLVFVSNAHVDEVWASVKQAVEEGRLGDSAKAATAKRNANATDEKSKVICVYTYDWTDKADVMRVRQALREIGVTAKIPYKADHNTLAGRYHINGDSHFSKYVA